MICKYCYKGLEFHCDPNKYVRAWCYTEFGDVSSYKSMTNLEYLEWKYGKKEKIT